MSRRLVLLAATALAAAAAPPAHATTVKIGPPVLTARVSVAVPLTVNCTPFDPSLLVTSEVATVSIEQAVNKQIAHGTGTLGQAQAPGAVFPSIYACDGTDQHVTVTVPADPSGPPFKRDKIAVLNASTSATANTPVCCSGGVVQTGSSGAVALKLK